MSSSSNEPVEMTRTIKLRPIDATPESFADFGQVISASSDRQQYGPNDAQLELHRGTPRFYIMHLEDRKLQFSLITHHASVTQCLGSASGEEWYLGVAKSSILEGSNLNEGRVKMSTQSRCGHSYIPPCLDDVCIFRVTGSKFLKLHRGTWHAGPLFKTKAMDFYNLELSDTNKRKLKTVETTKARETKTWREPAKLKLKELSQAPMETTSQGFLSMNSFAIANLKIVDHTTHDFLKEDGAIFVAMED